MREIFGAPFFCGERKKKRVLATSRKGCGGSCKGGKGNYYLKLVRRYCLRQSFKPFQPTPWGVLKYPLAYAMKLKC